MVYKRLGYPWRVGLDQILVGGAEKALATEEVGVYRNPHAAFGWHLSETAGAPLRELKWPA